MIQDIRQLPDGVALDTDLAIIGAGAAGITLARALADAPFRVCLVESGGFEPEDETQRLAEADNIGVPYGPIEAAVRWSGCQWHRALRPAPRRVEQTSAPAAGWRRRE